MLSSQTLGLELMAMDSRGTLHQGHPANSQQQTVDMDVWPRLQLKFSSLKNMEIGGEMKRGTSLDMGMMETPVSWGREEVSGRMLMGASWEVGTRIPSLGNVLTPKHGTRAT